MNPSLQNAASGETTRSHHHRRTSCRACGGSRLGCFLDLGDQPLANALLRSPSEFAAESKYPLGVFHCADCGLVQLLDVIEPEVLFGHYLYVTGTSETIAAHNRAYAASVVDELRLGTSDLVVEIASNDGSLLSCFKDHGIPVLGVEPARNIADLANERGIDTVNRFFDREGGARLAQERGRASAIVANNVLAHVDDPSGFLSGCRDLLRDHGRLFVEVPWARDMMERGEWDTIYHEHLCYFSVTSLAALGTAAGLTVRSVVRVPVHGGSIRVCFAPGGEHGEGVLRLMEQERSDGVTTWDGWARFGQAASESRNSLLGLLHSLRDAGKSVAAYGAPAKGNTLLNYCGIGMDLVPWTVDRNPLKVGLFTPGMHLPILDVSAIAERKPDYLLVLAWNFAEEIMRQQRDYSDQGGRFIIPIPVARVT